MLYLCILKHLCVLNFLFFSDRSWKMPSLSFIFSHWWKTAIELLCFSLGKKSCIELNARLYHQFISYTDSKVIRNSNLVLTDINSRAVLLVLRARAGETPLDRSICFWRVAFFRQVLSFQFLFGPFPHCTMHSTDQQNPTDLASPKEHSERLWVD